MLYAKQKADGNKFCISTHRQIPAGFKSRKDDESMRVIFRALLPVQCWGIINDQKPQVYLRFGNETLGRWMYDYGPGDIEK